MVKILEIFFSLALKIDFFKVAGKRTLEYWRSGVIASVSLSYMMYMQLSMPIGREVCYQCLWGGRYAINVYGEGGLLSMSMGREKCL